MKYGNPSSIVDIVDSCQQCDCLIFFRKGSAEVHFLAALTPETGGRKEAAPPLTHHYSGSVATNPLW